MNSCEELIEKKKKMYYVDEPCGCRASYKIRYEIRGKERNKYLCKRHMKSITNWLNRIEIKFTLTNL